jgi:hypothetical protein
MSHHIAADALLILHVLLVAFNVLAVPVIWIGYFRNWTFVRNFGFRLTHLLLIGFVAAESLVGAICPLTTWEEALRSRTGAPRAYDEGFIAYWLHRMIFFDLDPKYFTIAYVGFFALVTFTWIWVKPRPPKRSRS